LKRALSVLALTALAAAGAGPVFAEVLIDAVGWQSGRVMKPARPAVWVVADSAKLDAKKAPLLRGRIVLKNRGPVPAEGILVRYTAAARLAGVWALPFLIDERRVPKVGPNALLEVPLSLSPKLGLYLTKLKRFDFKPDAFKLQAMLEPHAEVGVRVVEASLEVEP
jgi:hypothetical protein